MQSSFFSVALSLGFPRPDVTRHPHFMESGLSSGVRARDHPAIRTIDHLGAGGPSVNGIARGQIRNHGAIG